MKRHRPAATEQWLNQLYCGAIYTLPSDAASRALVDAVHALLVSTFQVANIHRVHTLLSEEAFFQGMKQIRRQLFTQPHFIALLKQCFFALGFQPGDIAFEPLRLRAIRHNGHLNPRAQAVYYPHRDTWYGHGQSAVVGWLPLHRQPAAQTFEIFPDWLQREVVNNSQLFDYNQWRQGGAEKKIGWQKKDTGLTALYPQATETVDYGRAIPIAADRAERLFFSAAHFHKTLEQRTGHTRFSVDFRFVLLRHARQRIGAFNADARCRGSAQQDYIRL